MKLTPSDIAEIYFITDLVNMPSILKHGILSHNLVAKKKIQHSSIANVDVQGRRINKVIPGGKKLHDYANLYINARNPMLYVLLPKQRELCVIRISADVLRSAGVIVSDKNAARDWARFEPWPDGLNRIEKEDIFRERWDVSAEILVPYKVDSRYILGAYVSCQEAFDRLAELCPGFAVTINRRLFF